RSAQVHHAGHLLVLLLVRRLRNLLLDQLRTDAQHGPAHRHEGVRGVDGDQAHHLAVAHVAGQHPGAGHVGPAGPQCGHGDLGVVGQGAADLDPQAVLLGPEPRYRDARRHRAVVGEQRLGGGPALLVRGDPLAAAARGGVVAQVGPAGHRTGRDDALGVDDAQAGVAQHAVGGVEFRGAGQPFGVRLLAGGDDHDVGVDVLAVVEHQVPAAAAAGHVGDLAAEPQLYAVPAQLVGDQGADRLADGPGHHLGVAVDEHRLAGQRPYGVGGLAAGEAAADHHDLAGAPQVLPQFPGVGEAVQHVQAGFAGRPTIGEHRPRTAGDDQPVVVVAVAVVGVHDAAAGVELYGTAAEPPDQGGTVGHRHPGVLGPLVARQDA